MTDPTACRSAFEKWAYEYGLRYEPNYSSHTEADVFAAFQAAWNLRHNEGEAVAYLNTKYRTLFHAGEIGHTDRNDELLASGELVRLYTHPRATSAEVDGCQMLPKGWRIEVRDNGVNKGMCVFSPDGCFVVSGDTDHKSDIRKHVIELLDAALANRGEVG